MSQVKINIKLILNVRGYLYGLLTWFGIGTGNTKSEAARGSPHEARVVGVLYFPYRCQTNLVSRFLPDYYFHFVSNLACSTYNFAGRFSILFVYPPLTTLYWIFQFLYSRDSHSILQSDTSCILSCHFLLFYDIFLFFMTRHFLIRLRILSNARVTPASHRYA